MNIKDAKEILKTITEKEGTTVEHVRLEIQRAIDIGFENPNPQIKSYWQSVPHKAERPTPEEVICFIVKKINNKEPDKKY